MIRKVFGKRGAVNYLAMCLIVMFAVGMSAKAAEADGSDRMTLQQTVKDAQIKDKPEENADVLAELQKGTAVIVYGEPQNSWSQIEYDGVSGYVESGALEAYNVGDGAEDLDQEFEMVEDETERTVDEHELIQKSKRTSLIWGTVIAVLVVGIFAVGIVSALKKDKEGEQG